MALNPSKILPESRKSCELHPTRLARAQSAGYAGTHPGLSRIELGARLESPCGALNVGIPSFNTMAVCNKRRNVHAQSMICKRALRYAPENAPVSRLSTELDTGYAQIGLTNKLIPALQH